MTCWKLPRTEKGPTKSLVDIVSKLTTSTPAPLPSTADVKPNTTYMSPGLSPVLGHFDGSQLSMNSGPYFPNYLFSVVQRSHKRVKLILKFDISRSNVFKRQVRYLSRCCYSQSEIYCGAHPRSIGLTW